jgi:hypothetical protein
VVAVSLTAAAGVTQGFTSIPVALRSSVALSPLDVPVAVVGEDDTARVCGVLGDPNVDRGLAQFETPGDGVTTPVTVGGRSARRTVERVPGGLHMYFTVDPRVAQQGRFATTFTIEYYDEGTNSWSLQYDADAGSAYQHAVTVTNQASNTWRTAAVTVPDAGLAHRQNDRTDFRLASSDPVTIHQVTAEISGPGTLPMDLCDR